MDPNEIIRQHYSRLGRSKSPAKLAALAESRAKAIAATSAPIAKLEKAYRAVTNKKVSASAAARDIAECRYPRFVRYVAARDAGKTPAEAAKA